MTKCPLISVFLPPIEAVALCSFNLVLSHTIGQMGISYIEVTALLGPPICPSSVLICPLHWWWYVESSDVIAIERDRISRI